MSNEKLNVSDDGAKKLKGHEAEFDGLYDDPSGYCTYGIGHLVNKDKWPCFLLSAAIDDEASWPGYVDSQKTGKTTKTKFLRRPAKFDANFDKLKTAAVEKAKIHIAKAKYNKELDKLSAADQTKVQELAQAAVDEQSRLLAKTPTDVLKEDLGPFERTVRSKITVELNQAQFDACVSLAFNIGGKGFGDSTVVKKINAGKHTSTDVKELETAISDIEKGFGMWNKSGGKVLKGLTTRRQDEAGAFLTEPRKLLETLKAKAKAAAAANPAAPAKPGDRPALGAQPLPAR